MALSCPSCSLIFAQEAKKAIEEKLAREGSLNWSDDVPITIAESATVSLKSKELLVPQRKQRWELILWTVGMSILGALLFFFAAKKQAARPIATTTVASTSLTIPSLEGSAISNPRQAINLRISASPVTAKIFIDGKEISGNPVNFSVAGDGSSHNISIQASDFKPRTLSIIYDRDQDIVVALEQAPLSPNASAKVARLPRPSTAQSITVPAPLPKDCDPPFYMDERGIKRIKSGCM